MRRFALGFLAVVLLLGVGFVAGFLVSRQFSASSGSSDDAPRIRFYPGDASVFAAVPGWEEWRYPESKVHSSVGSASQTERGIQFSISEHAVLTTPADFDKVCEYYKRKCELRAPGDASAHFRYYGGGSDKDFWLTVYESKHGNWLVGSAGRSGKCMGFDVSTVGYHLAGFVYRGEKDDVTQLMLILRPQTEFISTAKLLRGQGEMPQPNK